MNRESVRDGILEAVYLLAVAYGVGHVLFTYVFTSDLLNWLKESGRSVWGFMPAPVRKGPLGSFLAVLLVGGYTYAVIEKVQSMRRNKGT